MENLHLEDNYHLSYHRIKGNRKKFDKGVIFLGGFMSNKEGIKACFLHDYCQKHEIDFVRFDYTGHGASSGNFEDGCISSWLDDAVHVIDKLTDPNKKQILVGSSMGAWIMFLLAMQRPKRIAALLAIAPALDFTKLILQKALTKKQKAEIESIGFTKTLNPYDAEKGFIITKRLMEDGDKNLVMYKKKKINIKCPVRIIHGMKDMDIPYNCSVHIIKRLRSEDAKLTLIKDGHHGLSREQDLQMIVDNLEELLKV